ncbi:MAG: oxidoreductase [Ignavibacteria bacterium RIFOXYB2_FULL_35_12]|nr:MAG: oxidoreductase [Ignavibacteria bacterium GWA2_36_19]OGU55763.1 MAG: oxidoreductase [Ignavibacteria bacterium GWC2_35_8]OGU57208.1 MAG: oxidoreductase [Ignavibacteria bacterium GWF2_35_20]OGU82718.1 MAG: oxidoreductase [Ignavibacteria bacterium RIFOXYA2_FULL_35_9]OGU84740.1 MAG: oxidoreductase [Ignavibacteria bacterium RIFOXYA12_FULL_35_25]OGU90692.1 MAG: oxidoreductase [Ignavibacteria bacterium RIFOXYC12_FULL_35_11]OGU93712.1 MAG: oxidoreductase [Ignavibacteria bacterium RIFOXYB12_FUL
MLSWITLLPILGMVIILFIPKNQEKIIKGLTLLITSIQVILAIVILAGFNYAKGGVFDASSFQFIEKFRWIDIEGFSWIGRVKIDYYLGIDGLSVPLVLLTAIICFISTLSSFSINKSVKGYFAMFLLLDTGMMGVFVSLDFFLFYIFWELMLLPMYFLIGIWGGPRKEYAAIKFFLYTLLGSVFILLAVIGLYFSTTETLADGSKVFTFNMIAMMDPANYSADGILSPFNPDNLRFIAFLGLFIGFAIKIPMFPFHTWLPDAHVEAPTAISVILAGVLLKMGTYGILRVNYTMFPEITKQLIWYIALFGMINIIYGALTAMAQKDFKKLIAYSSISHMGFVLLGMASLNTLGISGAVLQMFNHGTITAMLFLIVGVIYDRAHTRDIDGFGGLAVQMPIYTGFTTLAFFAAIGLPGLSGFISEAFVFLGSFGFETIRVIAIISTLGILLGAGYMLWTLQRIYLGKLNEKWATLTDMDMREYAMLVPLSLIIIFLGIYPSAMLDLMNTSVNKMVQFLSESGKFLGSIK